MVHFDLIAALFLIPLGGWRGGGGGGVGETYCLLQDCSPDPEIHDCFAAQLEQWWTNNIINVCFLKVLVANLHK